MTSEELEEIEGSDGLFRRLHGACVKPDGITITSATFITDSIPDSQASVDLARLTNEQESVDRADKPGYQLGWLIAQDARAQGHSVCHDPIKSNRSHSLIKGIDSKAAARKLARKVTLIPGIVSR